jgi:hypothetical protein
VLALNAPLRAFALVGGLRLGAAFDVDTHWVYRNQAPALRALASSGVAIRAVEHSGTDAFVAADRAALAPLRQSDGSYRIGASSRCLGAAP